MTEGPIDDALLLTTGGHQLPHEAVVTREIERLHVFISGWFRGEISDDRFEPDFADLLHSAFEKIQPSGKVISRNGLLEPIRAARGMNKEFYIKIEEPRLLDSWSGKWFLATYVELQLEARNSAAQNRRRSTVLFQLEGARLLWRHLQETGLPPQEVALDPIQSARSAQELQHQWSDPSQTDTSEIDLSSAPIDRSILDDLPEDAVQVLYASAFNKASPTSLVGTMYRLEANFNEDEDIIDLVQLLRGTAIAIGANRVAQQVDAFNEAPGAGTLTALWHALDTTQIWLQVEGILIAETSPTRS